MQIRRDQAAFIEKPLDRDRKSTRLNSSHTVISYAVFCLKKKNDHHPHGQRDARPLDLLLKITVASAPGVVVLDVTSRPWHHHGDLVQLTIALPDGATDAV